MKRIELLASFHDRDAFDCTNNALNQFLRQTARQHIQKGISRTFVLTDSEQPEMILGFFTLSACEVRAEWLPSNVAKKYPSTVPGVRLARLAVTKAWQRQGIGEILMIEAMQRTLIIARNVGIIGLFVDAKDAVAKAYYERFGFVGMEATPLELFLPLSTLGLLLSK